MFTKLHEQTADDWSTDWKHADNEEQTVKNFSFRVFEILEIMIS